ncbi:MAG: reverse transcriptase domain-containing protein, partial [Pseudomonadota bacterium]
MRNAAQSFQRYIDSIIRNFNFCFAYLDDILIASNVEDEHQKHLKLLFERFSTFKININIGKCVFGADQVTFLGYRPTPKGIFRLPDRVKAIDDHPVPQKVKEL